MDVPRLRVGHTLPTQTVITLLNRGRVVFDGPIREAVSYYYMSVSGSRDCGSHIFDLTDAGGRRSKVGKLLKRVELYTEGDRPLAEELRIGDRLRLRIQFELPSPSASFNIGIGFNNLLGQRSQRPGGKCKELGEHRQDVWSW